MPHRFTMLGLVLDDDCKTTGDGGDIRNALPKALSSLIIHEPSLVTCEETEMVTLVTHILLSPLSPLSHSAAVTATQLQLGHPPDTSRPGTTVTIVTAESAMSEQLGQSSWQGVDAGLVMLQR